MGERTPRTPHQPDQGPRIEGRDRSKQFCMVFTALGATNENVRAMQPTLEQLYGSGNVKVYNSMVSPDAPSPNRFRSMGQHIRRVLESGTHLTVVTHSSGTSEFTSAISAIEQEDPGFFDNAEHVKNLTVIVDSPVFNKGLIGALKYMGRFYKHVREEQFMPSPISKSRTVRRGIISLTTLPPKQEDIPQNILIEGVRTALPKLSQHRDDLPDSQFVPERDYTQHMPPADQEALSQIDQDLRQAIETGNRRLTKRMLKLRAKLTRPHVAKVYNGDFAPEPIPSQEEYTWTFPAFLGVAREIGKGFKGKTLKKMKELRDKRVEMYAIIPEYDVLKPLGDILEFFGELPEEERQEHIIQWPIATHFSPLAVHPEYLRYTLSDFVLPHPS